MICNAPDADVVPVRFVSMPSPSRVARVDQRLLVALVMATTLHGGLLMAGSFRKTYDAYVHLFFADHYARSWFSSWEPRWYTGFTTVSYPPASHQLLALGSKLLGNGAAFVPVALGAVLLLVVGVYRFSRIWVSERAAGYAAILVALSSSIAETVHVFGQLPTILSLALLLNSLPFAHRWVTSGGLGWLLAAIACSAATTAAHHVTTLFGSVFFLAPVLVHALLVTFRQPRDDERDDHVVRVTRSTAWPLIARRVRRVWRPLVRAFVYGVLVIIGLVVVVLPYWLWSSSDPITQIPIPHASRDSFLANTNAGLVFWLVPWGLMLLALPYALIRGMFGSAWPLAASLGLLTLLGTGGTTPIPRMLLGGAYEILTLDRFTFWATIAVLPLAGRLVESLVHGRVRSVLSEQFGGVFTRSITAVLGVGLIAVALLSANLVNYRPLQPAALDVDPIVAFLDKDDHTRWRYLTLGFGDQMAWLAAQTTAETVDGNYHSARRLPELTSTPVERLEGAKYSGVPGLGSLQQFLAIPEKYHLKFVFSNDQFYDPLLSASGWQRLPTLENGVAVWQHDDVEPLPAGRFRQELPQWQRLMWGVLPLTAVFAAMAVLLASALGADPARVRLPPPRLVRRVGARIDRRLASAASRIPTAGKPPIWQTWRTFAARWGARLVAPVQRRRRRVQALAVVMLLVLGGALVLTRATSPATPQDTVFNYYDALDLREIDVAYGLLDPELRPSYTQFLTERSVVNGLVASYARLDRIDTTSVQIDGDTARIESELVYLTALDEHRVTESDVLHRSDGRWVLVPHTIDITIPPDQLVSRPSVDYVSQGRRQITDGTTAYQDVIDRPELRILSSRLVRYAGQLSVVGELRNDDVDPGYITVSAELVDERGDVLTSYTAATGAVHTALPGEIVPFRIDFEGIAGLVANEGSGTSVEHVEFTPGARTPLTLDPLRIAEVRVSAKAVVTSLDLDRSLAAQRLEVVDGGRTLRGELRNDGLDEVTVPHVFLTMRDTDGEVGWVDDVYASDAIRPQRSGTFVITPPPPSEIERIDVPVRLFANNQSVVRALARPAVVTAIAGWPGADLVLVGFTRSSG